MLTTKSDFVTLAKLMETQILADLKRSRDQLQRQIEVLEQQIAQRGIAPKLLLNTDTWINEGPLYTVNGDPVNNFDYLVYKSGVKIISDDPHTRGQSVGWLDIKDLENLINTHRINFSK